MKTIREFCTRAMRRRGEEPLPVFTLDQAVAHLQGAVAEADRRGIRSPTMEAIRTIVQSWKVTDDPLS